MTYPRLERNYFYDVSIPAIDLSLLSGDGKLARLRVTQDERDRLSSCSIEVIDEGMTIADKLKSFSLANGGIKIPEALRGKPASKPGTTGSGGAGAGTGTGDTTSTGIPLSNAPEGTQGDTLAGYIVAYCKAVGVTSENHQAYILATCEHESGMGKYTSEIGGESTWYAPWYGRGLVQLTHESNYRNAGEKLGLGDHFIQKPDDVSLLKYAIPIMTIGLRDGWFTGMKLSDYGS